MFACNNHLMSYHTIPVSSLFSLLHVKDCIYKSFVQGSLPAQTCSQLVAHVLPIHVLPTVNTRSTIGVSQIDAHGPKRAFFGVGFIRLPVPTVTHDDTPLQGACYGENMNSDLEEIRIN